MKDKKRWRPDPPVDDARDETEAAQAERVHAASARAAMRQADAAMAAAGLHGGADFGTVAAAMRTIQRHEQAAVAQAQADVEAAMAAVGKAVDGAMDAHRHPGGHRHRPDEGDAA